MFLEMGIPQEGTWRIQMRTPLALEWFSQSVYALAVTFSKCTKPCSRRLKMEANLTVLKMIQDWGNTIMRPLKVCLLFELNLIWDERHTQRIVGACTNQNSKFKPEPGSHHILDRTRLGISVTLINNTISYETHKPSANHWGTTIHSKKLVIPFHISSWLRKWNWWQLDLEGYDIVESKS